MSMAATNSGNDGFIGFGDSNVVRLSSFTNNDDDGVGFFVGSGNSIMRNPVAGNGDKGVISGSSGTTIYGNQVFANVSANQGCID
jgi:hypothetical protein